MTTTETPTLAGIEPDPWWTDPLTVTITGTVAAAYPEPLPAGTLGGARGAEFFLTADDGASVLVLFPYSGLDPHAPYVEGHPLKVTGRYERQDDGRRALVARHIAGPWGWGPGPSRPRRRSQLHP